MLYYIYDIPFGEVIENDCIVYRRIEKDYFIYIFYIVNTNGSFRHYKRFKKNDLVYYNSNMREYKLLT